MMCFRMRLAPVLALIACAATAAPAQIRTATIPRGTVRGPTPPPAVTPPPTYPIAPYPVRPGYGWHHCYPGCGCAGHWWWYNAGNGYYYEDHVSRAAEDRLRRDLEATARANAGLVYQPNLDATPPEPPTSRERALVALRSADYD
ncbi:MAG: hypothetical protein KDA21_09590, partial [Phycisphaerales bacterium]|nr:hypothetical protein [Phycisphaerales bacterium]